MSAQGCGQARRPYPCARSATSPYTPVHDNDGQRVSAVILCGDVAGQRPIRRSLHDPLAMRAEGYGNPCTGVQKLTPGPSFQVGRKREGTPRLVRVSCLIMNSSSVVADQATQPSSVSARSGDLAGLLDRLGEQFLETLTPYEVTGGVRGCPGRARQRRHRSRRGTPSRDSQRQDRGGRVQHGALRSPSESLEPHPLDASPAPMPEPTQSADHAHQPSPARQASGTFTRDEQDFEQNRTIVHTTSNRPHTRSRMHSSENMQVAVNATPENGRSPCPRDVPSWRQPVRIPTCGESGEYRWTR